MTNTERLCAKLKNRELIFGTHIFCGAPMLTEAVAQCGFDVLWIDMEHTAIGIEALLNNLIAARAGGTPAWVRIPWNDKVLAKPVIDMGADGVIFPYVRTAAEAAEAVASCTYPPMGVRGYGPLRALDYGGIAPTEFVDGLYRRCLRIVQIEHVDAVRNLEEIAEVEGIDAFIVGPNDLSGSIGHIGRPNHPEVVELCDEIAGILTKKKRPFGVSTGFDPEVLSQWKKRGANILFAGNDAGYVHDGAVSVLEGFRRL